MTAAAPPLDRDSRVDDLRVTAFAGGTYRLDWTYRNAGDYDQNGEVNAADLVPLGRNLGATGPFAPGTAVTADGNGGQRGRGDASPSRNVTFVNIGKRLAKER
jgi:hypothetical protein